MEKLAVSRFENRIEYLNKVANLTSDLPRGDILQSYYLSKCYRLTKDSQYTLPKEVTKPWSRCPRCCLEYQGKDASFTVLAESKKTTKFKRILLRKDRNHKKLSKYQAQHLQKLKRKEYYNTPHNTLDIKCGVCNYKNTVQLPKPKRTRHIISRPATQKINQSRKNKRKRKKDKFSGLNKEAVLSVTPQTSKGITSNIIEVDLRTPSCSNWAHISTPINVNHNNNLTTDVKKNLFSKSQQTNSNNRQSSGNNVMVPKSKKKRNKENKRRQENLKKVLNTKHNSSTASLKKFLNAI